MNRFLGVAPRLPVADLDRTIRFYRDHLGFTPGPLWPADRPRFVILSRDAVDLQFHLADEAPAAGVTLCIEVEDALALHRALAGRLTIDWGPEVYWYGRREFAFRDPDGTAIIVTERTSDPPTCRDAG